MAYHSEVVFEAYKQAMLDDGHVCRAFLAREGGRSNKVMDGELQYMLVK